MDAAVELVVGELDVEVFAAPPRRSVDNLVNDFVQR
jgi:hypothetical protein